MNKAYVISVTTAIALGYAAGFTTNGLTASAGKLEKRSAVVEKYLTQAASTTLENFVVNQLCEKVVGEFDVSSNTCNIETFKENGVEFKHEPHSSGKRVWLVRAKVDVEGTWTPGTPQ